MKLGKDLSDYTSGGWWKEHGHLFLTLSCLVCRSRVHGHESLFDNPLYFVSRRLWNFCSRTHRIIETCKTPTLLLGSSDCLDILLFVRPPVYWAARALYHTGDMSTHTSSSVITFIVQTAARPTHRSHHTMIKSLTPWPFRIGVFNPKGVFRIYGNIGVD